MQLSVIGNNQEGCTPAMYDFTVQLGENLIDLKHIIICGGLGGVMEAICKGAHQSKNYQKGCTVGILPTTEKSMANPYVDIIIPSGMGIARNALVAQSGDAVIAIGGGSGTLSEIAMSWQMGKPIIAVTQFGGWSQELAGINLDNKRKMEIHKADSLKDIITFLNGLPDS